MIEPNGVTTGEFRVLRVVPQQNHQIQAAAPLLIHNTVHASQSSQSNNYLSGASMGTGVVKLSIGHGSGSSPSSSAKGKEKVSGPLLFENCKPAFQIGQLMQESLGQSHGSLSVNEKVTNSGAGVVHEVHPSLPIVVPLDTISALKESNEQPPLNLES
ncbi:unnamed protein product [Linum trigynum]|uniref:Uncharacterized protein n=1 Tax=Linum trigynum TaxID=586398 RepID=A0AAV2D3D9_9ROSI